MSQVIVSNVNTITSKNKSLKDFVASSNMPMGATSQDGISPAKVLKMFPEDGFPSIASLLAGVERFRDMEIEKIVDLASELNNQASETQQRFVCKDIQKTVKKTWSKELRDANNGDLTGVAPDGEVDSLKFTLVEKATGTSLDVIISNKSENNRLLSMFTIGDTVKMS
jgi:hypothetical protein